MYCGTRACGQGSVSYTHLLQEYIKPELFVLVPLMFGLGAALKADKRFPSANIPYTLALVGMVLAAMYVMATAQLDGWQSIVMAAFTAIVQGGLCALASVGAVSYTHLDVYKRQIHK